MTTESLPPDGGLRPADNPADVTEGDRQRAAELAEFQEVAAHYAAETAPEPTYSKLAEYSDNEAGIALTDQFAVDAGGEAAREDRDQLGRRRRVRTAAKPLYADPETLSASSESSVRIQDWTSKPFALGTQLSLDTLWNRPDHYSAHNIAPQPDGGRGMNAMAKTYVAREQGREQSAEPTVVWAYSHNGLDLRDFLHSVREQDGTIAARTRAVLACDSPSRLEAIEQSGIFEGFDVGFQPLEPQDPDSFAIPANTGVALLPDTLDKLPAHQVLRGANHHQVRELLESTSADTSRPIIQTDRRSGQARVIPTEVLRAHETADGLDDRYTVLPQLIGRLSRPERAAFGLEHSGLNTREESVEAFLADVPEDLRDNGSVFNYAEDVERIVEAVTASVREDGLVYISGPVRDKIWLHHDVLSESQGPVVSHVLEATSIRKGVTAADPEIEVDTAVNAIGMDGDYSYVLIDRSRQTDQIGAAKTTLQMGLEDAPAESEIALAHINLEQVRARLRQATQEDFDENSSALAQDAIQAYLRLKKADPQAGRDLSLALELARECNAGGSRDKALYGAAMVLSAEAQSLAPHLSGALVERAKAQNGLQRPAEANDTLEAASRLSPSNPEIYATRRQLYDGNPDFKAARLTEYVEAASDYLRFGQDLSDDEIIETLDAIAEALQEDFVQHQGDAATFKTIYEQDLETGTLTKRRLFVRGMKRIIAADAAEANAQVAGALMRYRGSKPQAIQRAQEKLLDVWNAVVPRGANKQPLPRDLWIDRNQNRRTRWLYSGSLYQDDAHVAPPNTGNIRSFVESPLTYEVEPQLESGHRRLPKPTRMSLTVGEPIDELEDPDGHPAEIMRQDLSGNVLITGRTGMGKTTLLEAMFEQVPDMKANFWAFDLGDKSELHTVADRLTAKGLPVVVIRPGAPDEEATTVPVSIDLFKPVEGCPVDAHIGKLVDAWITAYGGGGDSPVAPILTASLREIYAANGWKVTPVEGEALPEIGQGEPTTPTLQELLEACVKRASEYGKNTNAGNISVYFKRRIEALEGGAFGNFLVGENGLDWAKLSKANVVFDFSHITSHDQRRFLFTALTAQASSYLQFQKGLTKEIDMIWAIDEASLVTKDAGEGEMSRKQGVEAFTSLLKVVRGYGVSVWNSTQTTEGIHPDFLSQKAVSISLSMTHARDVHELLTSLGIREGTPEYDEYFSKLTAAERGVALIWKTGMAAPVFLKVKPAGVPTDDELKWARSHRPEAPIKANPYSKFSISQHNEAIRQSQSPEHAWKQLFIGAVVLAHVAQIDLPKVPAELQAQWDTETGDPQDAEFARLVLYHIAKQAVRERIASIRSSYAPGELTTSVMANALGLLYREPTSQRVSPAFSVLPIREIRELRRLRDPEYGRAPVSDEFAGHLAHTLPQPVQGVRKKVTRRGERKKSINVTTSTQVTELKRHHASPANAGSSKTAALNARKAFVGLLGNRNGTELWKSIRTVTESEPSVRTQRRLVAASLGYIASCFSPQESELEEMLSLAMYLNDEAAVAA